VTRFEVGEVGVDGLLGDELFEHDKRINAIPVGNNNFFMQIDLMGFTRCTIKVNSIFDCI
jgi:hypothetical protein